ncbi:MAG: rRNA maturation RNase YbeY [Phycisphaerae bacterium]|nr:rRNA maturation RNase YbeY [Phycisphaerae bacterium]
MTDKDSDKPDPLLVCINSRVELDFDADKLTSIIKTICRRFDILAAQINVTILDDKSIRQQNVKFLNHDYVTDVISFDLTEAGDVQRFFDIMVNGQMAFSQAKQRTHSPDAELALYTIHGLLHNLGFNDDNEKNASLMHKTEDAILSENGLGSVYYS